MNAQLPACKAGTLPLSYVPMCVWRVIERPFSVCRGGHCTWSAVSRVSTPIVILCEGTAPLTSAGSDPATTQCPSFRAASGLFLLSRGSSYAPAYGHYALRRYGRDWFRMVCHVSVWWGRPELHRTAGVPVTLRPDCVPHIPVCPGCQASFRFARKEKITREVQPEHFRW